MSVDSLMLGANAVRTVHDYVKLPGYYKVPELDGTGKTREYVDEGDLWRDAIASNHEPVEGSRVLLRQFLLSHWVPRVPGLYWKAESDQLRASADSHVLQANSRDARFNRYVYAPTGKTLQILGGVGNVRLLPTASGRLICASSSGEYWRGVPILIRADAWEALGEIPTGLKADVTGVWTAMPRDASEGLGGEAGIPRCCLVVNKAADVQFSRDSKDGYGSAWTLFERRDRDTNLLSYDFTYSVFAVSSKGQGPADGSFNSDNEAADYLRQYVTMFQGQVLTDYDELMPHFDALLPINELMSREVDPRKLRSFVERVKRRALSNETIKYDELPKVLMSNFDQEELRLLALDYLSLRLEDLIGPAGAKADAVSALITYCEEQDRLPELVAGAIQMRPAVSQRLAA
jgi:hypothetical protein